MGFFSPAPARIVSASADEIGRRFRLIRIRQVSIMLLGYALFYVCRLAFSATKKTMIEEGAYTAREIGYVGSALLVAYAIGKLACGFLADRANIRRMFAFGLFVSSLATMTVGFHVPAAMLMVVWFVNGLAQGSGSPCCVVSLARWWPNRSRGTFYGIWSCYNNLGEAIAYVVTSVVMVTVGAAWGADLAWRSGFWSAALFGFIGVALIAVFMRDSPQSEGLPSVAEWEGEVKGEAERKTAGDVGRGQRLALTNWAVWMVALAGGFFAMSRYAIIDWGIFFLEVKKGYATETAAWIITLNSIVGAVSSGLSGIISDRIFKGSRNELALMAGVLNITGLSLMMLVPVKCIWLDVVAMVCFGLAVGILLTFLGGLMAVDLVPRVAAGAALGIAGMGNYFGAGIQSAVSGLLVGRDAATGKAYLLGHTFANGYTIDYLAVFWIGMATLSVLCALTVWRAKR